MAILRGDIGGVKPIAQTSTHQQISPTGDLRLEVLSRLNQLDIGQQFRAEIVSRLDNGNSLVKLADTVVQMNMPEGTPVGEKVSLTLVAKEPRPTFLYEPSRGAEPSLSAAGRTIDTILRTTAQLEGKMPTLVGKAPLISSEQSISTPQLAGNLQQAIERSGLFYESHFAQWITGNQTTEQIKQEPQAQMNLPDKALLDAEMDKNIAADKNALTDKHVQAQSKQVVAEQAQTPVQKPGDKVYAAVEDGIKGKQYEMAKVLLSEQKTELLVDKQAAQMIRMQLETLEHKRIMWQGELWPGQELEWEISEDTPRRKSEQNSEKDIKSWQSVMRLELPLLGKLAVNMKLTGDMLQVHLEAKNQDTAGFMRSHSERLAVALRDAGTNLDYLVIKDGRAT